MNKIIPTLTQKSLLLLALSLGLPGFAQAQLVKNPTKLDSALIQDDTATALEALNKEAFLGEHPQNLSSLCIAALANRRTALEDILNRGTEVDELTWVGKGNPKNNRTPLLLAAAQGHVQIIEVLLQSGADITHQDAGGKTALHWAAIHGHVEATKVLIRRGAPLNVQDNDSYTPMIRALRLARALDRDQPDPQFEWRRLDPYNGLLVYFELNKEPGLDYDVEDKYQNNASTYFWDVLNKGTVWY